MFQQSTLKVSSSDGHNFVLLEPLVYETIDGRTIRAKTGTTTDGASAPKEVWNLIPPFGKYWFSAIMHDAAYRDTLEQLQGDNVTWQKLTLTEDQSNGILAEAMESQGVDTNIKDVIYDAVAGFGKSSFDNDRKIIAAGQIPPPTPS
jgi:hypothetical protein